YALTPIRPYADTRLGHDASTHTSDAGRQSSPQKNSITARAFGASDTDNRPSGSLMVNGGDNTAALRKTACSSRLGKSGLPIACHDFSGEPRSSSTRKILARSGNPLNPLS